MTVTYTALVATSSFSCFLKLLAMWRGSIYKLLWKDFAVFAAIYYLLSFIYRFVLDHDQQRIFELIATYCEANNSLIPVAFVLGFFINIVVSRWWNQLLKIPWPDRMAMFITASIEGLDERGRLMRRTIMRYLCLSYVITMSSISPVVRKRFPTFQHMVDSGFLLENELPVIEGINTPHNKYFVPLAWAMTLVKRARSEKRIKDDFAVKTLNDEINEYRGCLGTLFLYDWITIPLVYTQVVTLACYMFFFSCLMGRQFLKTEEADMYFPIFTFLQYFFYMGWLKVAESLINPFGEDDEDFDVNSLIDRNLQVSYLIVDEMHNEHPELIRDQYWDEVVFNLPYTVASEPFRIPALHLGSAMNINLSSRDKEPVFPMDVIDEETINSLTVPDIDSETNSENRPPRKAFRLNSITSSIKSGGRAGLNMPWKNRRVSKPISPNIPTKLSRHGRHSIRSSTSSVAGQNQAPTTPNSQNEYMFEMSDIENDPEEDGVLIDVPSPSVSPKPNPPKIVYAKTFNSKSVRPKFYIERVSSCDKESASEMNDASDDQLKDRTSLLGTRGSDVDTKRGDDPMPPSYTHELPTIEESRASVSDSLGTADSGKTPPKTNEQKD